MIAPQGVKFRENLKNPKGYYKTKGIFNYE